MEREDWITPIVETVINRSDPLCLLELGAPADEHDWAIQRIAAGLRKCQTVENLQELMYQVFRDGYGESLAGNKNLYLKDATEIFTAYQQALTARAASRSDGDQWHLTHGTP